MIYPTNVKVLYVHKKIRFDVLHEKWKHFQTFFKDNLPVIWTCHTSLLRHFGMSNLMWAVLIPGSLISIALTKCGKSQSWKYSNISYMNSRFKYHKYSYKNSPKSIDKLYYINASVWLLGIIWLFGQNCINEKYIIFIKAVKATISSGFINFQVTDFYKKNWTWNQRYHRRKSEKFDWHFLLQPCLDILVPECLNTACRI